MLEKLLWMVGGSALTLVVAAILVGWRWLRRWWRRRTEPLDLREPEEENTEWLLEVIGEFRTIAAGYGQSGPDILHELNSFLAAYHDRQKDAFGGLLRMLRGYLEVPLSHDHSTVLIYKFGPSFRKDEPHHQLKVYCTGWRFKGFVDAANDYLKSKGYHE
jgi:hypothetical protein